MVWEGIQTPSFTLTIKDFSSTGTRPEDKPGFDPDHQVIAMVNQHHAGAERGGAEQCQA